MRNWQHMFVVVVSVSSECGDMYNNQEHNKAPPMSPRISFSNDFVESSSRSHSRYRDAPVSSDFEFSVTNYSMMSADELFSKGRLLPLKEGKNTTLRDELQNDDDEDEDDQDQDRQHPPKNPTRWRGFLGLRKSHIPSKKLTHTSIDKRASSFHNHHHNSQSQEFGD
ncbi:hypothetical protein SASPL_145265 [Salvia splendens]|uniref:Uncharacterized protein n=1 Tax=Salvia splendens TaxID=180675 RepID=A0A8X8Z7I4_SALSN|nr:uncharacterized protein LOC121774884 [Salvia splendens]KAG6394676.1 hypothetical protein SASPL_145265 [Salvia splendens]